MIPTMLARMLLVADVVTTTNGESHSTLHLEGVAILGLNPEPIDLENPSVGPSSRLWAGKM
jgi:hypothetical protein